MQSSSVFEWKNSPIIAGCCNESIAHIYIRNPLIFPKIVFDEYIDDPIFGSQSAVARLGNDFNDPNIFRRLIQELRQKPQRRRARSLASLFRFATGESGCRHRRIEPRCKLDCLFQFDRPSLLIPCLMQCTDTVHNFPDGSRLVDSGEACVGRQSASAASGCWKAPTCASRVGTISNGAQGPARTGPTSP